MHLCLHSFICPGGIYCKSTQYWYSTNGKDAYEEKKETLDFLTEQAGGASHPK